MSQADELYQLKLFRWHKQPITINICTYICIEQNFHPFPVHSSQAYFINFTEFVFLSTRIGFCYCFCLCSSRWLFNCSLHSFCNFSCSVSLFQIFVSNSFRRYYFNWWYLFLWILLLLWMAFVHCVCRRANDIYIVYI